MLSRFFIDRPIFATVISVVIMLAGGVAVFTLPVAQYPEVTPPTVQVTAFYPGANAQTVRDTVAAPIEEQVSGVEGMMYMSSRCTNDGAYNLTVTFKLGTDSDMAQVLVQNRVSLALPVIPALVQNEGISVKKMSPNTLMIVNLISPDDRYDNIFLSNYATIYVKDELGRLPGVAGITYLGQRDYSLRAWLDPDKLAALNLSAMDVVTAIAQQNVQVAAGQIGQQPVPQGQQFQLTINTQGRLTDPEQFADIIVKAAPGQPAWPGVRRAAGSGDGQRLRRPAARRHEPGEHRQRRRPASPRPPAIVRLRDVARVELGSQQYDQSCTLDGKPSVALSIYPAARLQRPGHRRRRLRQDEGAEDALSRRAGLPDRLRHHAVHPRVGQRGLLHAARRRHPGRHRRAAVPAGLAGDDPADDRRAGVADRHLRGHGGDGLHAQQPDAVRPGAGHRHRRGRRHRRAGEHRAADRHRPGRRARPRSRRWRRSPARSWPSRWCSARCSFRAASWAASAASSSASSR